MDKFIVRLASDAEDEIRGAYAWDVRNWGEDAAETWIRELYRTIFERLSLYPEQFSIAPDVDLSGREVRQLILGRYRVLFEIRGAEILILHVRGPFTGT